MKHSQDKPRSEFLIKIPLDFKTKININEGLNQSPNKRRKLNTDDDPKKRKILGTLDEIKNILNASDINEMDISNKLSIKKYLEELLTTWETFC